MAMQRAIMAGQEFPPAGVAGTPENRAIWDKIAGDMENMPPGTVPEIPGEWVEMPDG